jgi:NACHT domain
MHLTLTSSQSTSNLNRDQDRTQLLQRVRRRWIEDVLELSLGQVPKIKLGLALRLDAVQRNGTTSTSLDHQLKPLAVGTTIRQIFDQAGGRLLILGPPGSGKTITLLELTHNLLDLADRDPTGQIPMVFNLSSWAQHQPPLADWLVEELHHSYEVPRQLAKAWVDDGDVLPLLDGLDEVADAHRDGCVQAINEFLRTNYFGDLVVCSGTEEYQALSERLQLVYAVELQPLTREQIDGYLEEVGAPVVRIRDALKADERLWELLRSPFMLSIVTQVYWERRPGVLLKPGTLEERRERLVAEYIDLKLQREPGTGGYTQAKTKRWLSRLAQSMRDRGESEFDLDRLQPDWLPTRIQRRLVTLIPAFVSLVIGGPLVGLMVGLVYGRITELIRGLVPEPVAGLDLETSTVGVTVGVTAGLVLALIAVIGGRTYEPMRALRLPWVGWGGGLGAGLVVGLFAGPVYGLIAGLIALGGGLVYELVRGDGVEGTRWARTELLRGLGLALTAALGFGLGVALGFGGNAGFVAGLFVLLIVGLAAVGGRRVWEVIRDDGLEGTRATINPVEELHWSSARLLSELRIGLAHGLRYYGLRVGLIGLSVGLGGGLGGLLNNVLHSGLGGLLANGLSDVLVNVLVYGLGTGLGVGLAVGLVNGVVSGLVAGLTTKHIIPNEGIRRSRRYGLLTGLVVGAAVGLVVGLVVGLTYGLRLGPKVGLGVGLIFGLGVGLVYWLGFGLEFGGLAYLRHLALRGLLFCTRAAPWHYVRFLDDATERQFLRRSGGSYIFAHRLLLEYFAGDLKVDRPSQP